MTQNSGLTSRETILLERVQKAPNYRPPPLRREGVFVFAVSGVLTDPVMPTLFVRVEEEFTKLAEAESLVCETDSVVVFPIICNPAIYKRNDFVSYKRREKSVFVGKNIEHAPWVLAGGSKRLTWVKHFFHSVVDSINDAHLGGQSRVMLHWLIDDAVRNVRRGLR